MPYDKTLADRIRKVLRRQTLVAEKEMFGGIAFMVRGNVGCGVIEQELMVRVGPQAHDNALQEPHVRPFAKTGRPSKGWVMIGPRGVASDADLKKWVQRGVEFALTLPAK